MFKAQSNIASVHVKMSCSSKDDWWGGDRYV